jgi:hypothetical protein
MKITLLVLAIAAAIAAVFAMQSSDGGNTFHGSIQFNP